MVLGSVFWFQVPYIPYNGSSLVTTEWVPKFTNLMADRGDTTVRDGSRNEGEVEVAMNNPLDADREVGNDDKKPVILLVDDTPSVLHIQAYELRMHGYEARVWFQLSLFFSCIFHVKRGGG